MADAELSPFEPEQLDEILSAELDGELDAAARDLGLSLDEVAARLRVTPGVARRRVALASARDLLGRPVEIDELTATRLRTDAMRRAETDPHPRIDTGDASRGRRRFWLGAGGVAAAATALVALAAGLGGHLSSTNSASSKSSSAAAAPVSSAARKPLATRPATDLGTFTDAGTLARAALAKTLDRTGSGTQSQSNQAEIPYDATKPESTTTAARAQVPAADALNSGRTTAGPSFAVSTGQAAAPACTAPPPVPAGDTPVLRATATLSGTPVIVLSFVGKGAHVVVIEDTRCKVLTQQTFP